MRALLVAVVLLTAGCLGGDVPSETASVEDGGGRGAGPGVEVFASEGRLTADVGHLLNEHIQEFEVATGAVAVLAELRWTPPEQDLDLVLYAPTWCGEDDGEIVCPMTYYTTGDPPEGVFEEESGLPGTGGGAASLALDAATLAGFPCARPSCTWTAQANEKAAALVDFELRVSVFYGTPPVDGYSAFEGEGSSAAEP